MPGSPRTIYRFIGMHMVEDAASQGGTSRVKLLNDGFFYEKQAHVFSRSKNNAGKRRVVGRIWNRISNLMDIGMLYFKI